MFTRTALFALAFALPLSACGDDVDTYDTDDAIESDVEMIGDDIEAGADDLGNDIEAGAMEAEMEMDEAMNDAGAAMEEAGDEIEEETDTM
jgi:hypothetical protein